jgi:hypothetical protein
MSLGYGLDGPWFNIQETREFSSDVLNVQTVSGPTFVSVATNILFSGRVCHSNYIWTVLVDEFNKLTSNCLNCVLLFIILYWLEVYIL